MGRTPPPARSFISVEERSSRDRGRTACRMVVGAESTRRGGLGSRTLGVPLRLGDTQARSQGCIEASRQGTVPAEGTACPEAERRQKGGWGIWELPECLSSGAPVLAVCADFAFCEDSQVPASENIHSSAFLSVNFNRCQLPEIQVKSSSCEC